MKVIIALYDKTEAQGIANFSKGIVACSKSLSERVLLLFKTITGTEVY